MTYRVDDEMRVKVADFGLSRDIQDTDFYKLTHRQKLPVKWMALESLFKNLFTEKSDVVCENEGCKMNAV